MDYNHSEIERKWREKWAAGALYKVENQSDKPKYYILDMFPYPSGAGLHVGHPLGYIASDIVARYKKQCGFNVLHPMGFDAFGLPAEQYAIQTGVHPEVSTYQNIEMYRSQLENIGVNYDWSRQVVTCDPDYYKWTQWIFLELFNHYYDKEADKALPIQELERRFEESGNSGVQAAGQQNEIFSAEEWRLMSPAQKQDVLMNYRLAYRKVGYVNWCEALGTVLANDEVKDGLSERGGHPVEQRAMMQWSLRITAYAERLLNDMQALDWPEPLKAMQSNWIGRSEGCRLFFDVAESAHSIEVFTTRPDTIFGATFMVLAPEHELVDLLTTDEQREAIQSCLAAVKSKSERERLSDVKEMEGAFTGSFTVHPFTGKKIPIYIGDYVLKDYGTGAIMAVPSDDDRDLSFAEKYRLPVIPVVDKSKHPGASSQDKVGTLINSDFLNGMEVKQAIDKIIGAIEEKGIGKREVNYKLRDANFSRQRYWGEPFPIAYDREGIAQPLSLDDLPLTLPPLDDFKPTSDGRSPLARKKDWVEFNGMTRETDTMPGFAGSSWYFLRYMDPHNDKEFASQEAISYWQDVDFYIGGAEHAVGHLMYSRFWHKLLYDKGLVPTAEPFKRLVNQGMIQGVIEYLLLRKNADGSNTFVSANMTDPATDYTKIPVHIDFVQDYGSSGSHLDKSGIKKFLEWRPDYAGSTFVTSTSTGTLEKLGDGDKLLTESEVGKMSKRYYNVVNPDDVVAKYGADCFRMYEMFLGPIEQAKPWDTNGIDGVSKFLRKFWNIMHVDGAFSVSDEKPGAEELKILHTAIKKVTEDIEKLSLNTAVSAFMVCVNDLRKINSANRQIMKELTALLAPFAPFIAEEVWMKCGGGGSVHEAPFPKYNASFLKEDTIVYPICINGKRRDEASLDAGMKPSEIESWVRGLDMEKWTQGKPIRKVIVVPGKMINLVV